MLGSLRKRLLGLLALMVVAGGLALAPSGPAAASSVCYWKSFGSSSNCDGMNPDVLGTSCNSDGRTVESAPVTYPDGTAIGPTVQLRYSPSCRTTWGRVVNGFGPSSGEGGCEVWVHRNSDGLEEYAGVGSGGTSAFTDVVYDAGVTSYAEVFCDTGAGTASGKTVNW